MPIEQIKGLNFHVQQQGSGPDIILIHGITGDLSIWYLCQLMQILSSSHRVLAYDLRGHGYSDAPATGYTSAEHATDLLAIMDRFEISNAMLIGHSFGAVISLHSAIIAPSRVRSLILSDPYFPALRHLEDISRWGHWQNFRQEAEEAGVHLSTEHWYDVGKFFDQIIDLDEERLLRFRQAVGLPALNRLLRLAKTSCGDDAKQEGGLSSDKILGVSQPVLALYGEYSPFLSTSEFLRSHLRDCREVQVPNAKHRAPEENPSGFLSAILDYIEFLDHVDSRGIRSK